MAKSLDGLEVVEMTVPASGGTAAGTFLVEVELAVARCLGTLTSE